MMNFTSNPIIIRVWGFESLRYQSGPPGKRNNSQNGLETPDWRVIFIEDARSITVIAVGNRKEIYD